MTLPPFRADATCPKCGHDDVHTRYQPDTRRCSSLDVCWFGRVGEHIHRHCRRCSYDWLEAPIDAADPTSGTEQ